MYLNVNLTPPPPAAAEGSCTTPKTPEILNSLINLTSPPLPQSYSQYQCEVDSGALHSPVSDLSSPGDESAAGTFGSVYSKRNDARHLADAMGVTSSYPRGGGGGGLVGGSPGTSGMGGPLAGASPPSTPDLPSPVNTVEATKSALIKEGLKLQIRSKLQAAGVDNPEPLLDESKIFKDYLLDDPQLTEEDEERRRRRRERNKVAATKCRNKKKEKTNFLMSESENVEDVNLRLKTEIQRLTSEKMKLEKLLCDPNHRAHCRHSGRCSSKPLRPPLVIVTPAESPDTTTSSSSSSSSSASTTSSSSLESPTSPPLPSSSSYDSPTTMAPLLTSQAQSSLPMTTLPPGTTTTSSDSVTCASSSSSQFLAPKYSPAQVINQRHHPYQFPARSHQSAGVGGEKQGYGSPSSPPGCQAKHNYNYTCLGVPQTHEFVSPTLPSQKSMYTAPKSRSGGLVRYNPYSTRPPPVTSPLATHTHPQPGTVSCGDSYIQPNNNTGCGREEQQAFVTDMHTNQFFPPCSYSNM